MCEDGGTENGKRDARQEQATQNSTSAVHYSCQNESRIKSLGVNGFERRPFSSPEHPMDHTKYPGNAKPAGAVCRASEGYEVDVSGGSVCRASEG